MVQGIKAAIGLAAIGQAAVGLAVASLLAGCTATSRVSAELPVEAQGATERESSRRQVVFYIDGAGGGGPITDGTPDVQRGFAQAGYSGEFRPFQWQTGLGALADETASVGYKRRAADRLATELGRAIDGGARVSVVASSAGTAIAIFALEALADEQQVESAAFMSSAVSADYDLSTALRHIRGRLIVFQNERDSLLRSFIPMVGSADRARVGDRVAGVYGFLLPDDAGEEQRVAYRKIEPIEWHEGFRNFDHEGRHTDCKNPRFISGVIAPRLFAGTAPVLASR